MEAQERAQIVTHPYRPTEDATPSEEIPLVIEGSDKLPAGNEVPDYCYCKGPSGRTDTQVKSSHGMPELRYCHCRKKSARVLRHKGFTHHNQARQQRDHDN